MWLPLQLLQRPELLHLLQGLVGAGRPEGGAVIQQGAINPTAMEHTGLQEVPWQQLAAAGRKGSGKKRARKRTSRTPSTDSSRRQEPDSTSDDAAPTELGTYGCAAALGEGNPITAALADSAPKVAPGHQEMKMQLVKILGLDEHIQHLQSKRTGYEAFILPEVQEGVEGRVH